MYKNFLILFLLFPSVVFAQSRPKVGVILPLTGEAASYGEQFRKGLELNPKNAAFEFIFEDSVFDAKTALGAFQKLSSVDNISYLISFGGATCEVLNEQARNKKIIHIAAGCNTAKFEDNDSVNFRLDVNEAIAAEETAKYLKKQGFDKIALLYINNSWGGTIIENAKLAFTKVGLQVVAEVPFESSQAGDLRSSLIKVRTAKPKVLFLISLPNLTPIILKQLRENKIKTAIMSNISVENPEVIRLSGNDVNGISYLSVKPNIESRDRFPDFYSLFPEGNPFAAWGYDSVSLISFASANPFPREALHKMKNFIGAFNSYTFDSHGELHLTYEIKEIQDGKYVWKSDL